MTARKMLKSIMFNRCFTCTMAQSQMLPRFVSSQLSGLLETVKDQNVIDENLVKERFSLKSALRDKKKIFKSNPKTIQEIKDVLTKYGIETWQCMDESKLAEQTPWVIEKRIMLLQELGVPQISVSILENFSKIMQFKPNVFKAHLNIDCNTNLAKNMLSYVKNVDFDPKMFNGADEDRLSVRRHYMICLYHYAKFKLELDDEHRLLYNKNLNEMYNSFRLIDRMVDYCRSELGMDKSMLLDNWWLLYHHPDHAEINYKMLKERFGYSHTDYYIKRFPRILSVHPYNLQKVIRYVVEYEITPEQIRTAPVVLSYHPAEFRKRLEDLIVNPYTQFYRKHPKFFLLLKSYYILLPRIDYLREKNLSFGTIHAFVTFHNTIEQLTIKKKLDSDNIRSFFETNFKGNVNELILHFKKHSFYPLISPVQMLHTLVYLRSKFTEQAIQSNVYAILYHKNDIEAAHSLVKKDPQWDHFTESQSLALVIYKIEENFRYTGEAVLSPEKFAESQQKSSDRGEEQDQSEKATSNVQSEDDGFRNK